MASSAYPPPLSEPESAALATAASDWAIAHGLTVRPPPDLAGASSPLSQLAGVHVPVTLFPSPFPRRSFEQARAVQGAYNELYAAVSRDEEFLEQIVKDVGDGDDFIGSLWKTHLKVKQEGYTQPLSLGLFRSDYMVHSDTSTTDGNTRIKQVEFNTIAASFGGLASQTSRLHRYLSKAHYPLLEDSVSPSQLEIPESEATAKLAAGIRTAFKAYGPSRLQHPKCVIFLVQGGERNVFDQRHLEYHVQESSVDDPIPVFRLPFASIFEQTSLADTPARQLLYRPPANPKAVYEVAVVYLRSGYGPSDYPDETAWEARYHIERSGAIKCPTVLTQLAGAKKVQQVLAAPTPRGSPSPLDRFVQDPDARQRLLSTFTNIYPMDTSPSGLEARQRALDPSLCQAYVLKPQREGGGNNTYRGAIPAHLKSVPEESWGSYILMEIITPPPVQNVILRNGALERGGVICELGVYGTCLWDQTGDAGDGVLHNEEAGYLLRTKGDQSEEGGVAAGFGCMDSITLV